MGWTGQVGTGTHAEIDRELMRPWTMPDGTEVTKTDCRLVNFSEHYHVIRYNGTPVVIAVTMIQRSRSSSSFGGAPEWLYKDMSEDMGPVIYACPLDLLAIVPEPVAGEQFGEASAQWAREWRQAVREYHTKKAAKTTLAKSLIPGSRIRLVEGLQVAGVSVGGTEARVIGKEGRKVVVRLDVFYGTVHLSPQHIAAIV